MEEERAKDGAESRAQSAPNETELNKINEFNTQIRLSYCLYDTHMKYEVHRKNQTLNSELNEIDNMQSTIPFSVVNCDFVESMPQIPWKRQFQVFRNDMFR